MANEVGSLNVRVGLDGTNFKEGIKQINRELKIAQTELKANATAIGGFGNSLDQLKLKSNSLQKQLSLHREKVEALEKEYKKSVEATGQNSKESQNLAIQLNNAKTAMNRVQNTLNSTNKKIEEQTNKWNKLSKQLKTTGEKLNNIGTKITDVGKSLSLKLTAPLAGVGFASVKTAIDFESSMSEVQAISGATGEQLKAMEEKAKEMGEKTSKSASESAQALKYMSLAGWDVETSIKALEPVLRLSEAGNIDLARASDLVTDSMSALGLTSKQLQEYLDKVAKTQASANTSADGMLEAYITAGGMFRQLNTDLDTSSAMIGILANRGIKASEAGTSLNSILVNLTGSTEKSSKVFNELGISLYDQQGNYKGVEQVLLDLKSRFSELDQEQQNFYMAQIAGKTQIDTFSALLDGLGKEYFDLKEDIKKSDGALLESARIMKDNFKGELEATRSKLESVGLIIANYLTPALREFNKGFQKVLDSFKKLSPQTQENIVKFGVLAATIGPVTLGIGLFVNTIGNAYNGLSLATKAIKSFELATKLSSATTKIATGVQTAFNLVLKANPIGIVITAVAGLTAAIVYLYKNNETVRESLNKAWNFLKDLALNITTSIKNFFDSMGNGLISIGTNIDNKLNSIWKSMATKTKNTWNGLKQSVKSVFTGLWNDIKSIASNIKKSIQSAFDIKLPHFELEIGTKTILGKEIKFPKGFDVSWHAEGGIFNQPTLLRSINGAVHGVGEAGAEAILPIEKLRGMIRGEMQNVINNQAAEININITGDWIVDNDSRKVEVVQELSSELKTFFRARGVIGGVY